MLNTFIPKMLGTPHVDLRIPISDGLAILKSTGAGILEEREKEHSYTISTEHFQMAIYEENGLVQSVWYDDPLGRLWKGGKTRKVNLYLSRFGSLSNWEIRMNNGWMVYYFNELDKAGMAYGIHNDVIRFNAWNPGK